MVPCSDTIKAQIQLVLAAWRRTEVFMEPRSIPDPIDAELARGCRLIRAPFRGKKPPADRNVIRALPRGLRGHVRRVRRFSVARTCPRHTHRRVHGARVHRSARLRARLILQVASCQHDRRPVVQPVHLHALRELAPPARAASCRMEQPGSRRPWQRHLFLVPDGACLSRFVAAPEVRPPARPSSVDRQLPAAASGVRAALSPAVRHAARVGAGAPLGPSHQCEPCGPVHGARSAAWLA